MSGVLASAVTASNDDLTGTRYLWRIVDAPPGSALQGVAQDGAAFTFSFTPDVRGSYRLWLQVWGADGSYDQDIRVFVVPLAYGYCVPPYQGSPAPLSLLLKPDELNISGQTHGWSGTETGAKLLYRILSDLDGVVGASTGPIGIGYSGLQSTDLLNASSVTGAQFLTVNKAAADSAFQTGDRIKITSRAVTSDWCSGVIGSFNGTTLAVTIDTNSGANVSHSDWSIALTGATPMPTPGTNGAIPVANGSSYTLQTYLRTPGALTAGGASGFLRATVSDVAIALKSASYAYDAVWFDTDGNGAGLFLGNWTVGAGSPYRTTLAASTYIWIRVGATIRSWTDAGLDMGGGVITTLGAPTTSGGAATKGSSEALVGGTAVSRGNSGASITIDWTSGRNQTMTITAACAVSMTAPAVPGPCLLAITCGGVSYAVTWTGANIKGTSGGLTASKTTYCLFWFDGTNMIQISANAY
jgi:hypothetical protein